MQSRALKLMVVAASAVAVSAQESQQETTWPEPAWADEGTGLPVIAKPTSSFFATRSDKEGADIISYSKAMDKIVIDRVKLEASKHWKWSSSDPTVDCNVLKTVTSITQQWDPCASSDFIPTGVATDPNSPQAEAEPSCVHSGLRRPEFDLDAYVASGKVTADENEDYGLSEYQTEKPLFNVFSLDITLSADGMTGTGVAVNYFPSEGQESVDKFACEQIQKVTVKVTQGSTDLDGTGFDGQGAVELVEIFDASGESLFIMSILKQNDGRGQILKLSDGYKPWEPSTGTFQVEAEDDEAKVAQTQALAQAWSILNAPRPSVQTQECPISSTKPGVQSSAPELQSAAYNWKAHMSVDYQGYKLYDEKVWFDTPPTHPGPFNWHPIQSGRSAFEGNRIHEINCDSDSAVYNWLGHGAIYTYEGPKQGNGYAFNALWTHDNHYEMSGDSDKIWYQNNFPGTNNGDAYTNRITICPNTKMEMTCSSVFFNRYGSSKAKKATRELFCVKDNQLYSDAQMSKMQQQADSLTNLYANCPEKNPMKDWQPPKQYEKEVFIILAGSVNNGDHVGKGGNISSGLTMDEFQFDQNVKCYPDADDREDDDFDSDKPGVQSHQNQNPVTLPASCDTSLSQRWKVHTGVKLEAQQHRDRAFDRGLEALFTYQDNGVQKVYDRITYIGHSRAGAKVNYLSHRHKNLYPSHNVRFVALGSMASIDVDFGSLQFNGITWQQKSKDLGAQWAKIPKRNFINNGITCGGLKGAEHDFAPYLLTKTETPFSTYINEFNSRICEKVVIKKKGAFNNVTAWKTYFTTNRVAHPDANKYLHFAYTPFTYYARGYDKLWY